MLTQEFLQVTYMNGGVHLFGAGIDYKTASFLVVLLLVADANVPTQVRYSTENIGALSLTPRPPK